MSGNKNKKYHLIFYTHTHTQTWLLTIITVTCILNSKLSSLTEQLNIAGTTMVVDIMEYCEK